MTETKKKYIVKLEGDCTRWTCRHNYTSAYHHDGDYTTIAVHDANSKAEARKIGAKFGQVISVE
jgi:hypothetical protein